MTDKDTTDQYSQQKNKSYTNEQENEILTKIQDLHWWSKKWISEFGKLESGNRLVQGKNYAKNGNVVYIKIHKGFVIAKVKGSKLKPYEVKIEIDKIPEKKWVEIIDKLSEKTLIFAKLLAGELTSEVDLIFNNYNLSLFPQIHSDVRANCSCADWANPCKHTAAVFYILGELFNKNPLLFFKLRGKSKEEILSIVNIKQNNERKIKNLNSNILENSFFGGEIQDDFIKHLSPAPIVINGTNLQELLQITYTEAKKAAERTLSEFE